MQIQWFTFLAQVINFLILLVLLKRFLYKPIVQAMDRREHQIADRLEEAQKKMDEAVEKEQDYRERCENFDRQKEQMIQQAREEVERQREQMLTRAREEIEQQQQRWDDSLEQEQAAFLKEVQIQTSRQILEVAQKMLADLSNQKLEKQVVEIFIQQLAEMEPEEHKRLVTSALDYGSGVMEVHSSFALTDAQEEQITKLLQQNMAPRLECSFSIDTSLGFGVEIWAGGWRTGWNLSSYVGQLRRELEQVFEQQIRRSSDTGGFSINGKDHG